MGSFKEMLNEEKNCDLYGMQLESYINRLYSEGLDINDYKTIKSMINELEKMESLIYKKYIVMKKTMIANGNYPNISEDESLEWEINQSNLNKIESLLLDFNALLFLLKNNVIPNSLNNFLPQECSIAHLVYTNNENKTIKFYATDSFLFRCQFHNERRPSLSVSEGVGLGYCFGCKIGFKTISYLIKYEKLSYREAVCLLALVYMIDIGNNQVFTEDDDIVKKYRNSLLKDEFKELLLKAIDRTNTKEETYIKKIALLKFKHDLLTIERVENKEWIKFDKDRKVVKRIILKPGDDFKNYN